MLRIVHHMAVRKKMIIASLLVGLVLVAVGAFIISWRAGAPRAVLQPDKNPATPVRSSSVEMKLLVMGDIYWGRYINDWSMASTEKYAYPFQALNEFDRGDYDAWVANMECPITNNKKVTSAQEDATLTFDCSPAYLPEASKWFNVVSLANNHTGNQNGLVGLKETREHLAKNGIQYFGTFDPEDANDICDVVSMPVQVTMSDGTARKETLPVVWCGYHGVFATPSARSIATVGAYAKRFTVLAMPHSGKEYEPAPDDIKTTFYRGLIDAGADAVIGNHAHWVQSSEAYKGRLIMYSLGNFIFDQQFSDEVTRSAVLSITATVTALDAPDLDKWLALADACSAYQDSCLKEAERQNLQKLPLQLHYSILGSSNAGRVTHRATSSQLAAIKERLQWKRTINGLRGQSSGE